MARMNVVVLCGNLTADPELINTRAGGSLAKLRLAVNNRKKDPTTDEWHDDPCYIDVVAFKKSAELAGQYLKKGSPILVEGSLSMDTWEDKATGAKRSKHYVIANNLQFLGGKEETAPQAAPPAASRPAKSNSRPAPTPAPVPENDEDYDSIPF